MTVLKKKPAFFVDCSVAPGVEFSNATKLLLFIIPEMKNYKILKNLF